MRLCCLQEFNLPPTQPTPLYRENVSVLALANNQTFHSHKIHWNQVINYHFIWDCTKSKDIIIRHIASCYQPVDIFTISLLTFRHSKKPTIHLRRDNKRKYANTTAKSLLPRATLPLALDVAHHLPTTGGSSCSSSNLSSASNNQPNHCKPPPTV